MKIWKLNDIDTVIAPTLQEAKEYFKSLVADDVSWEDFEEEFIDEPFEEDIDKARFSLDDPDEIGIENVRYITGRQLIAQIEDGKVEAPLHFSTEW